MATIGHTKAAPVAWTRAAAPWLFGLSVVLLCCAVYQLFAINQANPSYLASDVVKGYLPGAQRFLETGSPYLPAQVAGPYDLGAFGPHTFVHPPSALPLFLAFLALPLVLWWIVPLGITAYALTRLRPAMWTWPIMALALCWPRSTGALLTGNTDLWAMAFVAAGAVWGWPVLLLAIKPTFAPLALLGVRHRSTWIGGVVGLAFVAVTLPLWVEWWSAVTNAHLPLTYSLANLPLVLIPALAWAARR